MKRQFGIVGICRQENAMNPRRIVIADDNEFILDATATALRLAGYTVDTAENGVEALQAVDREAPFLILLDLRMPVLDGYGVARALRRQGRSIPVIVMTSSEMGKAWAEEIGAVAYLPKPFSVTELMTEVGRVASETPLPRAA
jgi:CheY-like chemotaxis protein